MLWMQRWMALACAVALVPLVSHCGDDGDDDDDMMVGDDDDDMGDDDDDMGDDDDDDEPTLVSLDVEPATIEIVPEETEALTVTGNFSDETTMDVTAEATYASSDDEVATVDEDCVVSGLAAGTATITATVDDVTGESAVTVNEAPRDDVIFDDDFGPTISFLEFGGSINDLGPTTDEAFEGDASLEIVVPAESYTGGSLVAKAPRDVTEFDAITFWAKADSVHNLNVVGLGNDLGENRFATERAGGIPLTTEWTEFTIPIPDPSKADALAGLFHFAEGSDEGAYIIYLDEIRFVTLGDDDVTNPRPGIAEEMRTISEGTVFDINGTSVTYAIGGEDVTFAPAGRDFFEYISSDTDVIDVNEDGRLETLIPGNGVTVTATLAGVAANGTTTIDVVEFLGPRVAAPTPPSRAADDVISIFSDAYTDVAGVNFVGFSNGELSVSDETVAGNATKKYSNLVFVGIRTLSPTVDATDMTHVHVDIWIEDAGAQEFKLRLADNGADDTVDTADDTFGELIFTPSGAPSPPALETGTWQSFDIPLTDFQAGGEVDVGDLVNRANLAQYILVSTLPGGLPVNLWFDNLYLYREP